MCQSQLRAIMTADDEFAATMQLLSDRGVLDNTLVIFTSDNGYKWGEHGRTEKFVPYEPSLRVPLWCAGPAMSPPAPTPPAWCRTSTCCRRCSQAAGFTLPAAAPRLDGESLLSPTQPDDGVRRVLQGLRERQRPDLEDGPNRQRQVHPDLQRRTAPSSFREYYNLTNDPAENTNLLARRQRRERSSAVRAQRADQPAQYAGHLQRVILRALIFRGPRRLVGMFRPS